MSDREKMSSKKTGCRTNDRRFVGCLIPFFLLLLGGGFGYCEHQCEERSWIGEWDLAMGVQEVEAPKSVSSPTIINKVLFFFGSDFSDGIFWVGFFQVGIFRFEFSNWFFQV